MKKPDEIETRQDNLDAFLRSLSGEERMWLARRLQGEFRRGFIPRKNLRDDLLSAELWLARRIEESKKSVIRQARLRLWFIFMLLRYGALRPGEVLCLAPEDFSLEKGVVRVRGEEAREIALPLAAAARMRARLQDLPDTPGIFQCDPGLLRRNLRQCAKACGLAPGSLSPSGLRKNRALELELSGLPYALINLFLGHHSRNSAFASGFTEPWRIIKTHIQEEYGVKTSARNVFQGKVSNMRQMGILVEVTVTTPSGLEVQSVITETSFKKLDLREGKALNALVKAPFVRVVPANNPEAVKTPANYYRGKVEEIHSDDVAEEILVRLPDGQILCSLDFSGERSLGECGKGEDVFAFFNSFSVILSED